MIGRIAIVLAIGIGVAVLARASKNTRPVCPLEPSAGYSDIVGDGDCPWNTASAQWPQSARVRDIGKWGGR